MPIMGNSPLVDYTNYTWHHSGQRLYDVTRITPHCVVGQCTVEGLAQEFQGARQASSNYGIGADARVGLYVDECNRSWCSSSSANDQRAITIECACDPYYPFTFKDIVFEKLIALCADICKRYGKTKLLWFDDKDYALSYIPAKNEMILTAHRWFWATACPGDWMYNRMGLLASRVTALITPVTPVKPTPTPKPAEKKEEEEVTQEQFNKMMEVWMQEQAEKKPENWAGSAEAQNWAESKGYIKGNEKGQKMYRKLLTREEFVQVLYRILGSK